MELTKLPKLWAALISGKYDLANQMINSGANINEPKIVENFEMTLLHYAVHIEDIQCIRVLINLGANINALDNTWSTPLHRAAKTAAKPDIVELLLNEGAIIDARNYYGMTPLHCNAERQNICIESTQKLIARGASIEAVLPDGRNALHLAMRHHNIEMIKVLISHRVNIDAKDMYGHTPLLLYFPRRDSNLEILQLLVDNGADVNSKSHLTQFPLLYAAALNHLAAVHFLLKRGARVNEATKVGMTALHAACQGGLADVTALLLKFGANLDARNQKGKTAFELLPNSPFSEATAQIIIREAVKREALGQSLSEGYKQIVQSCENYSKFDQECREEIRRMKSESVDAHDSAVSFFQILLSNEEMLAGLARNETIITAFESSGYVASFRIYASEFTTKFAVAKERANFLLSVEDCLGGVLGDVLPVLIVRKIAEYVKYGDIIEHELNNDWD